LSDIGKILVQDFGKKKYYKPEEVKKAHKKSQWYDGADFSCWAMSTFSSQPDFNTYHHETGEECDYTEMKSRMLEGWSITESVSLVSTSPDNDTSWLDIGNLCEAVLDGFGELISGITDGL
jgi:hypothetical protein